MARNAKPKQQTTKTTSTEGVMNAKGSSPANGPSKGTDPKAPKDKGVAQDMGNGIVRVNH